MTTFFGIFRGFSGVRRDPQKPSKMTLRTPKNDPPGTSRGPLRNPPKRGVFGGFSGGFRGVFWGPRRGGFRGSRRAPGAPEKGHFGGGDPGGRAARPPGEDRGGGGATMHTTRETPQTERPWSDVLRRFTPKAELQGNG